MDSHAVILEVREHERDIKDASFHPAKVNLTRAYAFQLVPHAFLWLPGRENETPVSRETLASVTISGCS